MEIFVFILFFRLLIEINKNNTLETTNDQLHSQMQIYLVGNLWLHVKKIHNFAVSCTLIPFGKIYFREYVCCGCDYAIVFDCILVLFTLTENLLPFSYRQSNEMHFPFYKFKIIFQFSRFEIEIMRIERIGWKIDEYSFSFFNCQLSCGLFSFHSKRNWHFHYSFSHQRNRKEKNENDLSHFKNVNLFVYFLL